MRPISLEASFRNMKILAIETSCDETAVAIVEDGQKVHCNVIASQIDLHTKTGGVVPEVASREHMKVIPAVIHEAFEESGLAWNDIDSIAVTKEPGLVGSLIVGRMTAATLAFAKDKPLLEVNHIHGHMYSTWLGIDSEPEFPLLILTVSGGHNELVLMKGHGDFELLGETIDDAAGEAFDKSARLLGLGYPGGPAIEQSAKNGFTGKLKFPVANIEGYDFSFSGLKTAVLYYLQKHEDQMDDAQFMHDVALAFQTAVVEALVKKVKKAISNYEVKELHLAGGVSANKALRSRLEEEVRELTFRYPKKNTYCTDNAAMIGAAAYWLR